ncbi:MAG: YebC/PmpR family DNA-binding transcriptional regulator [Elusimicrobia bacterium HGW-Elusimicrobia-1]|jgi:YebC/PmpR family DNA-binding regulatory protein|nr:MAG: YebC/PmpR family DNA-binding transcriptional regulator [Elusimicrobia bacterium HGW-Elusimicrobia-1]
MSGHSKWAGIKHKKAIIDAKRGKVFTRVTKEITIAARMGGGNPEHNARLRKAIDDARDANMPLDNIKKAVQRGTGELPGVTYDEISYEGYGPGGVAVIVEAATDNRSRTASEFRRIFARHGGNLGENGCVAWMFSQKGYIAVDKSKVAEDEIISVALESGADDVRTEDDDVYEIITAPAGFEKVKAAVEAKKIPVETAEVSMQPSTFIKLRGDDVRKMLELMEELEDSEDTKTVFANFDISKEDMGRIADAG